ncbi:hypothetical protein AB0J80_19075 [Actinoplanes sp. NPDC049548]|uniref:hypothetical protein n=1 Tax=Actinoplanes sp. NPDC049548 TaxID=3155152 RepID=UPI00342AF143
MEADQVVKRMRLIAADDAAGLMTGSDRLIRLGLDALLAGVDSPSLPLLAGLTRAEEPEAQGLFHQVLDELGIEVRLPDDPVQRQWALVRCWAGMVVDGVLEPAEGGGRICWAEWWHGWPAVVRPIVDAVVRYEDLATCPDSAERQHEIRELEDRLRNEARALLAVEPWPPV